MTSIPPLTVLFEEPPTTIGTDFPLHEAITSFYGGNLHNLPTLPNGIYVNMTSTIDGVTAFDPLRAIGGSDIHRRNRADAELMSCLRATADVILLGATTFRHFLSAGWAPHESHAQRIGEVHHNPTVVVISKSGHLPTLTTEMTARHAYIVLTTAHGLEHLQKDISWQDQTLRSYSEPFVIKSMLTDISALGFRQCLAEGGPHLLGSLFQEDLVRDLFLTLSPALAGRALSSPRLSLIEGMSWEPDHAPFGHPQSIRTDGSMLFLRYRFNDRVEHSGSSPYPDDLQ